MIFAGRMKIVAAVSAAIAMSVGAASVRADFYWDTSASSGIQGGDGNWHGNFWNTASNNSLAPGAWTDGTIARFNAGTNNVTVNQQDVAFTTIVLSNANTNVVIAGDSNKTLSGTSITVSSTSSLFELAGGTLKFSTTSALNSAGTGAIRVSGGTLAMMNTSNTLIDLRVHTFTMELTNSGTINVASLGIADNTGKTAGMNISSGTLNATGDIRLGSGAGASAGGNATILQMGGTVTATGDLRVGSNGTTAAAASYTIGGGSLSVANVNIYTNSNTTPGPTANTSALTLQGTGKLKVSGILGKTDASKGWTASASTFSFNGGTLVAGTFNTAAFSSDTLTNHGGILAPGDIGTAGKTTVSGNFAVDSADAVLAIDIGGANRATAFQSGDYDYLAVTGSAVLAGDLVINLINGFTPDAAASFTFLTVGTTLTGGFDNVVDGWVATADGSGKFAVSYNENDVTLSNFTAVPEPASLLLIGIGALAVINKRKRA